MKPAQHLNDSTIQEYVTNRQHCTAPVIAHMQTCTGCQQKAALYQQLITAIQEQPVPVLGFDIATLVMPQLPATPAPAPVTKKQPLLPALLMALVVFSILVFFLQRPADKPATNELLIPLCFLLPVALGILWVHIREAYNNYQKQLLLHQRIQIRVQPL